MIPALDTFRGRRPFRGKGRWETDAEVLERSLAFVFCRCGRCAGRVRLTVPDRLHMLVGPWGVA